MSPEVAKDFKLTSLDSLLILLDHAPCRAERCKCSFDLSMASENSGRQGSDPPGPGAAFAAVKHG